MDNRNYHADRQFDSVKNWYQLSAVMAEHLDWTVQKCKRRLLHGYTIDQIKHQTE